jgi:small subunit ribosomal protein S5
MIEVPRQKQTIPHRVEGRFKSANVLLKPAAPGTGIIAGGPVRAVLEVGGINDVLSKSMGSQNAVNIVKAVFQGLSELMQAREVAQNRGKTLKDMWG